MSVGNTREATRRQVDGEMRDIFGINHKRIPECLLQPLPLKTQHLRETTSEVGSRKNFLLHHDPVQGSVRKTDREVKRQIYRSSNSKLGGDVVNGARLAKGELEGALLERVQEENDDDVMSGSVIEEEGGKAFEVEDAASIVSTVLEDITDKCLEDETCAVMMHSDPDEEKPTAGVLATASLDISKCCWEKKDRQKEALLNDATGDHISANQNGVAPEEFEKIGRTEESNTAENENLMSIKTDPTKERLFPVDMKDSLEPVPVLLEEKSNQLE